MGRAFQRPTPVVLQLEHTFMTTGRAPMAVVPFERVALFIDGWNFKCATFDAFGLAVDFSSLLSFFCEKAILLRAYYYIGEWDNNAIDWYIRQSQPPNPDAVRADLEQVAHGQRGFWRFLNRN